MTLTSSSMPALVPHLKSKALRLIAVYEKERLKEFPDITTFTELGYPLVFSSWHGMVVPKKMPEEIFNKLLAAFKRVLDENRKSIEERLANMSLMLDFAGPAEFAASLKGENEAVKKIVKELMATAK